MSYGQITMLNQLPELEDLEPQGNHVQTDRPVDDEKYNKYIRGNRQMLAQSGMNREEYYQQPPPPQPHHQEMMQAPVFNCLDIAKHVQDCPICSRFYNNDKTVYIIAIIVLSIVCLLLLKKVLNV